MRNWFSSFITFTKGCSPLRVGGREGGEREEGEEGREGGEGGREGEEGEEGREGGEREMWGERGGEI